jgi:hypothetical protein
MRYLYGPKEHTLMFIVRRTFVAEEYKFVSCPESVAACFKVMPRQKEA